MSRDLRLCSLALAIVVMLWFAPARASYVSGTACPALAVPVQLSGDDVWASYDNQDEWSTYDYRDLYPAAGTNASADDYGGGFWDCELEVGAGTYYDGANHMWVLDDDLTCTADGAGDFRAGNAEY